MFSGNIESLTLNNTDYRRVLFTSPNRKTQLVIMSLQPKEDIGTETHPNTDQFIRVEKGVGMAIVGSETVELADGIAMVIPAGTEHNIINTSNTDHMKLYTIYSPAEHDANTIQHVKPTEYHSIGGSMSPYYGKYMKYKTKYLSHKNS